MFEIQSSLYTKWYKETYHQKPVNNAIAGDMDRNIEGWAYPNYPNNVKGGNGHFQIVDEGYRPIILQKLKQNILQIGIPFLEEFSNWKNAAHHLVQKDWFHHTACDFFLIADDRDKAYWALQQGLKHCEIKPLASFPEDKDEIFLRLKKHFNENRK